VLAVSLVRRFESGYEHTHDISLSTNSDETVDVLADRNQDFASHVSTLLGAGRLVLDVNASSSLLDEKLGKLHDSSKTTVTGICVRNKRPQEIDVGSFRLVRRAKALFTLLAVVEKLGHEQMADLVGNSCVWVVCKIRTRLVGG
jgi:hypothetical protein